MGYNLGRAMEIRGMSKRDFDSIVSEIDKWWGGPVAHLAHPVFFYEFGDSALVAEDGGEIVGFLFGFMAPTAPPVGYVHLVGVRPDWRNRHLGQQLYERFMATCRARGVRKLRAVAAVADERSKKFHERLGFSSREEPDYAGSGRARVVFSRDLE